MDRRKIIKKQLRTALHSAVLILGMAIIAALCAYGLWGWKGMFAAFSGVILGSALAPSFPAEAILRTYGARPLARDELPDLFAAVSTLSVRASLPNAPELWYMPTQKPLALTVGVPSKSAIMLSNGLIRLLTRRELMAVIAHEIGHVRNHDLRITTIADMLARMASIFANAGILLTLFNIPLVIAERMHFSWPTIVLLIVSPTIASLLQLALSRTREFEADMAAADLTGDPEALVAALMKMEAVEGRFWESMSPGRRMPDLRLLRTHPLTRERVGRLRERGTHNHFSRLPLP
ncbi:zinc metalloprotease HtpX [Rhizobium sp. YS-1r]|uniref:zinc metalloprotease HtpX n=1 Tax=Rhizobium sp. YS-1r TaxID=1532558 RepID=UPI0006915606|nr:zinc metalloprotease HtpX [Rhizobium sp. YS-1r]